MTHLAVPKGAARSIRVPHRVTTRWPQHHLPLAPRAARELPRCGGRRGARVTARQRGSRA